ncbi:protein NUCLEAR FUSION DEFECTIVE 4-like [Phalaenopsis equestris]|uniref:protein NUCLEAR FUSION DEFECTIVE 4-like n=1 Tax=Phalaenopsis equestris TaxID=78828 RepID=UPI0009E2B8EE|nr:protein NUCLEAR FUSION DEFECTIVE 4-like [Phalaenopsis equestris]XP_020580597.1 protein NUCLEAR FUSION DEFECTIVE 4-like [Phalaenopsis equestris]
MRRRLEAMEISTYFRRNKWTAMAASVWIQCTSGSSYCFGIYSPLLKSSQSYDQSTLDSVAFFKDAGANIGVLSGFLYSYFASGDGPIVVLAAGAIQCFAGYFLMWLSVTGALPRPPPGLMCFYMLLAAHSQTFFNTADVVTAVENFPGSRGTVVGIMKGFLGLSGAILIQIFRTLFNGNSSSFLLMLALLPSLLPLLLMFFVQVHHTRGGDNLRYLKAFSFIVMSVAIFLMIVIIGEHFITLKFSTRIILFLLLLLLLLSPLSVVFKAHLTELRTRSECPHHDEIRLIEEINPLKNKIGQGQTLLPRVENMNLFQAMSTSEFWLLFLVMACAMGSGLATVNNISQIGSSLDYSSTETSTLVSLWSIWNFLGRFGGGYMSDYFLREQGCARPFFIALTLALMSVGHVIISSGFPGSLHLGSVLIGVCYGSQWSLMPTITSELFGIRHFGTIFNTVAIASPVGSFFLSVRVVGYIYDMESSSGICKGRHCFMLSFLIMAFTTTIGFFISMALFFRTRMFYKQFMLMRTLS